MKNKAPLILLLLLFLVFALWAQKDQPPTKTPTPESKIPPEEAAKVNPVKPTAGSLAKGKKIARLINEKAVLRSVAQFKVMGKSARRFDGRRR